MKIPIKLSIIVLALIAGLVFCSTVKYEDTVETFSITDKCPNLLVRKGNEIHLVNTKKAMIPGKNPIRFKNLEEYVEFTEWQKSVGIKCPVLYYQQTYDAQNKKGYRILQDPEEPNAGLPSNVAPPPIQTRVPQALLTDSNRDDPPYNQNQYSGFDPDDQYIGLQTPLDNIKNDNPLNPNIKSQTCP